MEDINRWKSLAGIITEGPLNAALSRGDISSPEESKEFGLYVGERNSGQLDLVFKGDKSECLHKWQNELIGSFGDKRMVFRVVPMYDGVPNHITETFEETDEQNGYTLNETEAKVDEPSKSDVETSDKDGKVDKEPAVKVPADISKAINTRVAELKAAIEEFDEKGFNDNSVKKNALEALEQVKDNLSKPNGKKLAVIFYGTLMGPIQELFPPKVVKFLYSSSASKKPVTEARYNQDFEADDQIGHNRLKQALKRLDDKVELVGNRGDEETNNYVSSWCQSNIAQAFWNHAADHLDHIGFMIAASNMREHAAESGYH
jgi:hypothetical protein